MSVPSTNEDFDACFEPDAPTTLSYEWFSIQIQITCAYTAGGEPSDPQSAVEPAGDAAAASAPVTIAAAANAATTARRIVRGTTVRTVTDRLGPVHDAWTNGDLRGRLRSSGGFDRCAELPLGRGRLVAHDPAEEAEDDDEAQLANGPRARLREVATNRRRVARADVVTDAREPEPRRLDVAHVVRESCSDAAPARRAHHVEPVRIRMHRRRVDVQAVPREPQRLRRQPDAGTQGAVEFGDERAIAACEPLAQGAATTAELRERRQVRLAGGAHPVDVCLGAIGADLRLAEEQRLDVHDRTYGCGDQPHGACHCQTGASFLGGGRVRRLAARRTGRTDGARPDVRGAPVAASIGVR